MIVMSCKKQEPGTLPEIPVTNRTIQFTLYTDKDFSNDQHNVFFSLIIHNSNNQLLWDSALAPMKLKDIPGFTNKISVKKLVPLNNRSLLKVGFRYIIEDGGHSTFVDSMQAGETLKIVDYNFQ